MADILTEGSFIRDEGNHDLSQVNIMSNSMFSSSHLRNQIKDPRAVSTRQMEEGKQGGEDERVVANSRLARHVVSMTLHQSATVPSSSSSQSLENMTAKCSKRQCLAGSTESEVIVLDAGLRLQGIPRRNFYVGRSQEHGTFSIASAEASTLHGEFYFSRRNADEVSWKHLSAKEQTLFSKAIETEWQGVLDFKAVTIIDSTQTEAIRENNVNE